MGFLTDVRWSPYAVGIGIGVLSWISFYFRSPLACSTTFARAGGFIERLLRGPRAGERPYYRSIRLEWGWQEMLVSGIAAGALVSSLLGGDFRFAWVPPFWEAAVGATVPVRVLAALLGGLLLGFGARWADGCTSGHGISGTMQLAVSSWVSTIFFFAGGILAAHLLYRTIL